MSNSIRFYLPMVLVTALVAVPSGALGSPAGMTTLEHLNSHVLLETLSNGYWMIQQEYGIDTSSSVSWSGAYNETGWTGGIDGTLYGTSVKVDYTGTSTVQGDHSVRVAYQGAGAIGGTQTVTVTGTGLWEYDAASGLYTSLYLEDQGRVDTPVLKWWHKALEAVGGGILGGMAGGVGGVIGGATAGVALSEAIWESTVDGGDPPIPGNPALIAVPDWDATITYVPDSDEIISRIFGTGNLDANVRNQVILNGTWNSGVAGGTAVTVPEPMTLSVLAAGAGAVVLRRRRGKGVRGT